jgi:large subunit ribosomal protein L35
MPGESVLEGKRGEARRGEAGAVAAVRRNQQAKVASRARAQHFFELEPQSKPPSVPIHRPLLAMAPVTPSLRQLGACLRCVRPAPALHAPARRLLSSSSPAHDAAATTTTAAAADAAAPSPPQPAPETSQRASSAVPEYMQSWGTLDPQMVENKKQERRLVRRDHVQPVGSRRRRAALRRSALQKTPEIPFEQLPYQCFQEARKVLLEDRKEKLSDILVQQQRIEQAKATSKGPASPHRIRNLQRHLDNLVILADINDPVVKRKFEDGQGTALRRPSCAPQLTAVQPI